MDFLLKEHNVVVEVKKTRRGLADHEVGKQLIEDVERYRTHPNCGHLICFVYDPDSLIRNPRGLERDISGIRETLAVDVLIRPK